MTAQVAEVLIIKGKHLDLSSAPKLPKNDPRIIQIDPEEAARAIDPNGPDEIIFSTACWREYIGTWEIKDGRLYLVNLKGIYKKVSEEPMLADWFTGELRIPQGEELV